MYVQLDTWTLVELQKYNITIAELQPPRTG